MPLYFFSCFLWGYNLWTSFKDICRIAALLRDGFWFFSSSLRFFPWSIASKLTAPHELGLNNTPEEISVEGTLRNCSLTFGHAKRLVRLPLAMAAARPASPHEMAAERHGCGS